MIMAQKLKEAEITEEHPKPSPLKYFNVKSVHALDMETKRLMPMDAESRRFIEWMERGVYDALQRRYLKTLMFSICERVDGPMIEEYSCSFIYPDSEGQDVVMNIHKKQGGTFNDITPNQKRCSASKMVCTLVQLMRTHDKMPDHERTIVMKLLYYDDVTAQDYERKKSTGPGSLHDGSFGEDETQGPAEDEQRLARVKDSLISHHLDTLKLTDDSQPSDYSRRKSSMVLGSRRPCSYFPQGLCRRGEECRFLHSSLPKEPDTAVCKYFQEERCNRGDQCRFLHISPPGKVISPPRKVVCRYFQEGHCNKGDQCQFLHPEPIKMDIPSKSRILKGLPREIRRRLKTEDSVDVSSKVAKRCLDEGRQDYVDDTVGLKLSDRNNFLVMFWVRKTEWRDYLVEREEGTPNRITAAIGRIRNQEEHDACWSYADADLVAGTRLLHGLDGEFRALCTRYLIQNVDKEEYNRMKQYDRPDHACFGCSLQMGLAYIQKFGIPEEEPGHESFSCLEERKINRSQRLYKIEGFYEYETLDQALVRLRTHPVAATLYGFTGWDGRGIYRGPMTENAGIEGLHAVVMCELRMINGEPIILCKSSNGDDIGGLEDFPGFIAVAANVMIMIVGKDKTKENKGHRVCPIKPSSLLTGFYSVEMPYKDPSFKLEEPKDRDENKKVDISEYDWQIGPSFEEDQGRQKSPAKRGRRR